MLWHVTHTAADKQCLPVCLRFSAQNFHLKKPHCPLHCSATLKAAKSLCTAPVAQGEAVDCIHVSFGTWGGSSRPAQVKLVLLFVGPCDERGQ